MTDVPAPVVRPGFVMVRTAASLISAGTERMTVESGTVLASTGFDRDGEKVNGTIEMNAAEGIVIDLDP